MGGFGRVLSAGLMVASLVVPTSWATAHAAAAPVGGAAEYSHDAAGQLVGVRDASGGGVRYDYDEAGNLRGTDIVAAGQVAVFSVVPEQAAPGASVTVNGTGFGTGSTVRFGDTNAEVTQTSPSRLTVTVPAGARTGPVKVTTPAGAADSPREFRVVPARGAPTISGFAPASAASGTTVTITGSGFETVPERNIVTINRTQAQVISATDTSLGVVVPEGVVSGPVSVRTANGVTGTTSDLVVTSAPYKPADVSTAAALAVDGASQTVNIGSGKVALLRFSGTRGQSLSLGLTGSTVSTDFTIEAFTPYGTPYARLGLNTWKSSNFSGSLSMAPLPATGMYQVVLDPENTGSGNVTATLSTHATGTLNLTGSATSVTFGRAGRHTALTFDAVAGQWIGVGFTDHELAANTNVSAHVLDPNGAYVLLGSDWSRVAVPETADLGFLAKLTGRYTVVLSTSNGSTGSVKVTGSIGVDRGTINQGGDESRTFSTSRPGQDGLFTFSGTAGQKLTFITTDSTFDNTPEIVILHEDGTLFWRPEGYRSFYYDAEPLPRTGTYRLVFNPQAPDGSAKIRFTQRADGGTVTVNGSDKEITIGEEYVANETTFSVASAGDYVSLGLTDSDFDDSDMRALIIGPDGSRIAHRRIPRYASSDFTAPLKGTYRLIVQPYSHDSGSITVTLSHPFKAGDIRRDSAKKLTFDRPAQRALLAYEGTAGQKLNLTFSDYSSLRSPPGVTVWKPDGSELVDQGGSSTIEIPTLPVSGVYQFAVTPRSDTGSATLRLTTRSSATAATGGAQSQDARDCRCANGTVDEASHDSVIAAAPSQPEASPQTRGFLPSSVPNTPIPGVSWSDDLLNALAGDPVELSTGLLTDTHTDLGLSDTVPIALNRTYWQGDGHSRSFGRNQTSDFDLLLTSARPYQEYDLYVPGGGKVHFVRTSAGSEHIEAVFTAVDTAGRFQGATVLVQGYEWVLRLRDGTSYYFPYNARVRAISDRNGNNVSLTRTGGNNGEVTQITSPNGRWIALEYDSAKRVTKARDNIGRSTSYAYDDDGRLVTVVDVAGKATNYAYDSAHRITKITDARGIDYLAVTYDDKGRVATQTLAGGQKYAFAYTLDAQGKVTETKVTNPNGSVRQVVFTGGRVASDTQAFGSPLARTTTYVRGTSNRLDAVIDPYGRRTEYTYDAENRPTEVIELAGTSDRLVVGRSTYGAFDLPLTVTDAAGKVTRHTYDGNGNLLTTTDPLGLRTTMTWTPDGRIATVTSPANAVTTFTYASGSLATVKDPLGRIAKEFSDAAGRPVSATDPAGSVTTTAYDAQDQPVVVVDPLGRSSTYAYDTNGNLVSFTDARGKVTRWGYDDADRPVSRTDPLGATSKIEYDDGGRAVATVSKAGVRNTSAYDLLDRPTTARFGVTDSGAQSEIGYAYDSADRLASMTDTAGGTTSYTYDVRDRVISATGPNGTVGYGYDVMGRRTSTALPGLAATSHGYDDASRLTSVGRGSDAVAITRDAEGRPTKVTLPGGWTRTASYDAAGQLTNLSYAHGGAVKGAITYTYDAMGQRTSATGTLANVTLPQAASRFTYDDANRLTTAAGTPLTYDADGNLLSDGTTTYTWNARGQLTGTTKAGLTASYRYDAVGVRSARTVGETTTRFLLDGPNVAAELDGTGAVTASLLTGDVDQVFARTRDGITDTVLNDALGSPAALGRSDGTFSARQGYDPFGLPSAEGDRRGSDVSFTGRHEDGNGLLDYRSRYYRPDLRRFISEDSIGLAGGTNLYSYAANSPATLTDPSGNNPFVLGCVIGGGLHQIANTLAGRKTGWGSSGFIAAGGCVMGALRVWPLAGQTWNEAANLLGKAGENWAGVKQKGKVAIPSLTGTSKNGRRIPDALTATTLTEIKNVGRLNYTNQLKDFVLYAKQKGLQFDLVVRQNTRLSKPLQEQVDNGSINLIRSLP
ncbi:RHS repeat-associated core domain-containing protein [Kibdelosporangium persicum]|uniref:RHS repeat-associated core domain-containing protein n=1 Tax=Kibdelosporangium persicum TaxID=2698649 RepID=A0ABX2FK53_9PSEU|nr:RHS repeat-associated core domain-containing protein [Kibdelosporangium persicum]NRN71115.1 hypothetical protein [Kibdelosporangium persicum]